MPSIIDPAPNLASGTAPSRAAAWGRLGIATLIAAVGAALLFAFFWFLPFGDAQFSAFANWFYRHSALLIAAALSPLLASLLVGYGYMSRAVRRRAAEKTARRGESGSARTARLPHPQEKPLEELQPPL